MEVGQWVCEVRERDGETMKDMTVLENSRNDSYIPITRMRRIVTVLCLDDKDNESLPTVKT